jgi:ubiquinone/menaquinone biosynthesis C-methylase UbiE
MNHSAKRRYFDELAPAWDQLPKPQDQPGKVRRYLERALPEQAPRRILDVGCGTGILLERLLELAAPQALIIELDFAWGMLAANAARTPDRRVARVCADSTALPFRAGSFQAVLLFNVLPHLGPLRQALHPLLEALEPGGALAVGHLMSSEQLNAFHAQLGGPVSGDRLPPVTEAAGVLAELGAGIECAEEAPDWYFLRCRKG